MALLPRIDDEAAYARIYADDGVWLPAMRAICARHGLPAAALRRATLGSDPVYHAGDAVIKLFPPFEPEHVSELAGLRAAQSLPVPVPQILHVGELEGWTYAVLSRVEGVPALEVWPRTTPQQQREVTHQVGTLLARLHDCAVPPDLPGDWDSFLQARIAGALAHHDADEPWRSWIARRLADFQPSSRRPVLLHADITADHVLLQPTAAGWRISGLIDFGDARVGHPFYELIAPLAFYAFGDSAAARALLEGYGLVATPDVRDELTTWCLLHEFGRIADFIERCPVADGAGFEAALWGAA